MSLLTKIYASAEIFLMSLFSFGCLAQSIADSKTSSCPDTSCACPAAPQCGCLHTHVNLTRLQQRMCPAVSKKVFQAVSIRYSKIYPLFSICALSSLITTMLTNMLKEVTFEYWRLQSGFSWKAAIISLVHGTVCTSNIFCVLLNLVHDTVCTSNIFCS